MSVFSNRNEITLSLTKFLWLKENTDHRYDIYILVCEKSWVCWPNIKFHTKVWKIQFLQWNMYHIGRTEFFDRIFARCQCLWTSQFTSRVLWDRLSYEALQISPRRHQLLFQWLGEKLVCLIIVLTGSRWHHLMFLYENWYGASADKPHLCWTVLYDTLNIPPCLISSS